MLFGNLAIFCQQKCLAYTPDLLLNIISWKKMLFIPIINIQFCGYNLNHVLGKWKLTAGQKKLHSNMYNSILFYHMNNHSVYQYIRDVTIRRKYRFYFPYTRDMTTSSHIQLKMKYLNLWFCHPLLDQYRSMCFVIWSSR